MAIERLSDERVSEIEILGMAHVLGKDGEFCECRTRQNSHAAASVSALTHPLAWAISDLLRDRTAVLTALTAAEGERDEALRRAEEAENEIRASCDDGSCRLFPAKGVYHDGCDGAFCAHDICQECGATLVSDGG